MGNRELLESIPLPRLISELRTRGAREHRGVKAALGPLQTFIAPALGPKKDVLSREAAEMLAGIDADEIHSSILFRQKAIYGTDDRKDIREITDPAFLKDGDSVVAVVDAMELRSVGKDTVALTTEPYGKRNRLCKSERFWEQPSAGNCTGFLVGPDLIVTAGHCVNHATVKSTRFVFGYRMLSAKKARIEFKRDQVYSGAELIARKEEDEGSDYALVRIDRRVEDHAAAKVRKAGKVGDADPLHVIGHPVGLPLKLAGGAAVRDNSDPRFFVANLDTYGGNSGSPVFNSVTHEVEGILVRGETDFVPKGKCFVSLVCPTSGCEGEACTRISEVPGLVA